MSTSTEIMFPYIKLSVMIMITITTTTIMVNRTLAVNLSFYLLIVNIWLCLHVDIYLCVHSPVIQQNLHHRNWDRSVIG